MKMATITMENAIWDSNTVIPKQKRWQNVIVGACAIWLSSRLVVIYDQFSYGRVYFGAVRYMCVIIYTAFPLMQCNQIYLWLRGGMW